MPTQGGEGWDILCRHAHSLFSRDIELKVIGHSHTRAHPTSLIYDFWAISATPSAMFRDSQRLRGEAQVSGKHFIVENVLKAGCPWSWKVMEFRKTIFRPGKSWKIAKVMESHGKVMENDDNVMEFLLLH